ncbi:MAG: SUMF1/EgtB/PvdO family nonheme iron enzyme [Anabaena sp. CoA2_C59]|jgi:formylglycine-generating enzyme required for sulfatase activity|nr:SUMF1/EgtB/PvdO family nonheme iron enzyme [Anabaena sp. CoA2_C59]MDJ0507359.1 SUMF1/EgtB/PvdO family nonheme iron enzyme [Nostocales cyanobacterium LE14-WE12]
MGEFEFDVFLCHNSQDSPAVIEIANQLKANNINPWLDKWHLRPGSSWQDSLEDQIDQIRTAAVFVGNSGLGPWQIEEIKAFLRAFVNRKCPVIPVLLPNAPKEPKLPVFLQGLMWVDFREHDPEPLGQLIWGITGIKPDSPPLTLKKPPEEEKNKSPYQLKTFPFQTAQISLTSALLGLVKSSEIQRITKNANYFGEDLGNGVILEMVDIPGGTFKMGSPKNQEGYHSSQSPQHEVTVPPFFMGKYPVTQQQWRVVAALENVNIDLKSDPSHFKGDNLPVECVSWDDAQEFCARLSRMANKTYRLPTEAEWEYACRGGTTTPFYFGETISTDLANYNGNWNWNWTYGQYREKTTEVGIFPANPFGLYDMCGNVWEWCEGGWHKNYINAPIDGSAWTSSSSKPGQRGGSWDSLPGYCRCASRFNYIRDHRYLIGDTLGFRVVCVVGRIIR